MAKSGFGDVPGETLLSHTKRVLRGLEALNRRMPGLGDLMNMPRLWHWAAMAVLFHDVGKCAEGFQKMLQGGKRFPFRHEVLSAGILPWVLGKRWEADLPWIAAGVLSHHKDLSTIVRDYPAPSLWLDPPLPEMLLTVVSELEDGFFSVAPKLVKKELVPLANASPLFDNEWIEAAQALPDVIPRESFAGSARKAIDAFQGLSDRLRQQDYRSPLALAGRFIRGLVIMADHAGSAWENFSTLPELTSPASMAAALKLTLDRVPGPSAYEHQIRAANELGNATLIAPTGSGKTEAALLWAARNGGNGSFNSPVFYVLPYQASLNAMRARLGGKLGHEHVVLQHSRALQAIYRQLLDREYHPAEAKKLASREISLGKLHVSPLRVLTPYQLLRGAFQLKGHEALWTDAAGSRIILDEIHAYDPARLGMILGLLQHLTEELRVRLFIMSATMPSVLQSLLEKALHCTRAIVATKETFAKFKRHRLRLRNRNLLADEVLEEIIRQVKSGLSVLVVATTVARAQHLYLKLSELLSNTDHPVRLLHGKFCVRDRLEKEQELMKRLATGRTERGQLPFVLVATQVVEVSLDVDFDVLYSDPAPLEALFQRFGRVNRARLYPEREVVVMTEIPEGSPVYNRLLVEKSIASLAAIEDQLIDEAELQALLDSVYAGSIGEWWQKEVQQAMAEFKTRVLTSLYPFESDERLEESFAAMFDGEEVLPLALSEEYHKLAEEDPLLASALLVSVSHNQFARLMREKQLSKLDRHTFIAHVPYSSAAGLQLTKEALNLSI